MNGDLRHGPGTDEAMEKMRSKIERRRWYITLMLVQTISPGERMCECNSIIYMSRLCISMSIHENSLVQPSVWEFSSLDCHVEVDVLCSGDWSFSHICQAKCQLHVAATWEKTDTQNLENFFIFSFSQFSSNRLYFFFKSEWKYCLKYLMLTLSH